LAAPLRCDLTDRDFSDCAIPYSYFYERDLSGCNFTRTNLANCLLIDAKLDKCKFVNTNMINLKFGRYTYFIGHSK
jgi:uncharacterized protein YjbI with pentapeptide repeats